MITPSHAFTFTAGGEAQHHPHARGSGPTEIPDPEVPAFSDSRSFQLAAVYGSLDVRPLRELKLSAAGRLDYYSTFGTSINPRLALIATPYAGGNFKILAGKAFKAPSLYELYYAAVGQLEATDLQPENIYSLEVELNHRFSRNVVGTLSAYSNYITDLITLETLPSEELQYQNARTPVGTLGAEVELRRDWKEGTMLSASYSLQRSAYLESESLAALVRLDRSPDYREVPNAPMHLASVKGAVPLLSRALTLMTRLSFEGGRYDMNDRVEEGTDQIQTEHAFLWDFVFSGSESRWGVDYAVGVYNAFDSRARYPVSAELSQRAIPIAGRSLVASGSLRF